MSEPIKAVINGWHLNIYIRISFKPCKVHQNNFYFQCLIGYAHRHDTGLDPLSPHAELYSSP